MTPFDGFSDHALIKLCLNLQVKPIKSNRTVNELDFLPCKYVWNSKSKEEFLNAFNLQCVSKEMRDTLDDKSCIDVEKLSESVTSTYKKVASLSLKRKLLKSQTKHTSNNKQFNNTYTKLKHEVISYGKLLQKYPFDPLIRACRRIMDIARSGF